MSNSKPVYDFLGYKLLKVMFNRYNDEKLEKFSFINQTTNNQLSFYLSNNNLYEVLQFISLNKISLIKIEKNEPTLESLFMEVIK